MIITMRHRFPIPVATLIAFSSGSFFNFVNALDDVGMMIHNHPSGDPQPSRQDIALTRELVQALKPLGIHVHDHVIVGTGGQASLRGMGLL